MGCLDQPRIHAGCSCPGCVHAVHAAAPRAPRPECLVPGPWHLELRTECDVPALGTLPFGLSTTTEVLGTQE